MPVRFDTRFYVALAPPHSPPSPDGAETTEAAWISPREALDRHAAGELSLVFPTIKHLESLLPYSSAEEVLAAARDAGSSRSCPASSARVRGAAWSCPASPG